MKKSYTLFFLLIFSVLQAAAQCGTDPASGTTSYSGVSNIPNSYYPGTDNPTTGTSTLALGSLDGRGSSSVLANGDLVVIMQMQGADFTSTNTSSYGDGISGGDASGYSSTNLYAGQYEYNVVSSFSAGSLTLLYPLTNSYYTRSYSGGAIRSYQVIRVPRAYNVTVNSGARVSAPAWNGSTGGVVILDAANVFTITGSINVSGLGFRGGGGHQMMGGGSITNTDYRINSPFTTPANQSGGAKGEGICGTPYYTLITGSTSVSSGTAEGYNNGCLGRGAPGNAGGGASDGQPSTNGYNTGGGGGSNAGAGGHGGAGWYGSAGGGTVTSYPYGGYGGAAFAERNTRRIIMGGGGGAGTANNSTSANEYQSSGACGGGIIILRAKSYAGTGSIVADGGDAVGAVGGGANTDAAGGGGAGGSIIAVTRGNVTVGLTGVTASAKGGAGGNMDNYYDHGPGGGGGGGFIITNGSFSSANVSGGSNGFTRTGSTTGAINNSYGSTSGGNGQLLTLTAAPGLFNASNVASPCGVLPVVISSFTATLNGNAVTLNWDVADAIAFSHFEVEYSTDGIHFSTLHIIPFHDGQSHYMDVHSPVQAPQNFYRLKLVDVNGSARYSNILLVRTNADNSLLRIFPQPANASTNVSVSAQLQQTATFTIYNSAGTKMQEQRVQLAAGRNTFTLNGIATLAAGIYVLKTTVDGQDQTAKLVIQSR